MKINQIKIPLTARRRVRITKVEDIVFNGAHPNRINQGYVRDGLEVKPPTVGESYMVEHVGVFQTSTVQEITDDNHFRTLNSIYRIDYLS